MQHVEVTRSINAPIELVWDRYTDHRGWTDWAGIGTVTIVQRGTGDPNGVGCVRRFVTAGMGVYEEVLSFERPKRMTYKLIRGAVPIKNHLGEVLFEAENPGLTKITWRCRFDSSLPLIGGLLRAGVRRMFATTLDRFATHGGL